MALRLAGERALVIQGTDNQGWVRDVTVQDSLPGLKINQKGTGWVFDFQDGGASKMYLPDGGNVSLVGSLVFDLANDVTITPANPAAPRTLTIPDPGSNDTFAFLAAAQTLTNKTLTSPTIQGTMGGGTGLTMPAFTAGGNITGGSGFQVGTSAGDLVLNPAANVSLSKKISSTVGAWMQGEASASGPFTEELVGRKTGIVDNTATGFITVTVLNRDAYARIVVDYYVNSDNFDRVATGRIHVLVVRNGGTDTVKAIAEVDTQLAANSRGAETMTVTFANSANTGAAGATQTFTINVTIDSSVVGSVQRIQYRASVLTAYYATSDPRDITIAAA